MLVDISKAFDRVWYDDLLKLKQNDGGNLLRLIKIYQVIGFKELLLIDRLQIEIVSEQVYHKGLF